MSTINFYIDKPDRKENCPLMLVYRKHGSRFRYYTKLKINQNYWEGARQAVKKTFASYKEYNSLLESLKENLRQIEREALFNKKHLTIDQVREKFELTVGKHQSSQDFYSLLNQYLKKSKVTKTHNTVKGLYSSFEKLKAFSIKCKYSLNFDSINKKFYDLYIEFLIEDCGHLNNTVGKFIKAVKFFMNYATDLGINKNLEFKKFKVFQEEVDLIYHPNEELLKLLFIPIENEKLYNVRENYCFSCLTGLRFSDISKLKDSNIENEVIKLWTVKTKSSIIVPLNSYAKQILERNKDKYQERSLPPCYSLQKMNVYLKEIGQLAELNDPIQMVKFSGSKRIETINKKFELMSFHAARRTFITLSLEKGMRPEIVMQIVGIKKWETFKRYIKLTENIKIIEMNTKWNDSFQLKAV
jgi:integrase